MSNQDAENSIYGRWTKLTAWTPGQATGKGKSGGNNRHRNDNLVHKKEEKITESGGETELIQPQPLRLLQLSSAPDLSVTHTPRQREGVCERVASEGFQEREKGELSDYAQPSQCRGHLYLALAALSKTLPSITCPQQLRSIPWFPKVKLK